jgi:ATP-dependent Clp protease protease subunit
MFIPYVIEQIPGGERSYDLFSRLLKDRIVILNDEVNDQTASVLIAQFLFLEKNSSGSPIEFYINSPGGSVSAGLAIYDVMQIINAPVNTTCLGLAASMGAVLLAGGTGTRSCLPHARVMIHQVSSGYQGTAADMNVQVAETNKLYDQLLDILSVKCKQDKKKLKKDCDRDYYMSATEAKAYGIIDQIITPPDRTQAGFFEKTNNSLL